jgi:hypothetical protein
MIVLDLIAQVLLSLELQTLIFVCCIQRLSFPLHRSNRVLEAFFVEGDMRSALIRFSDEVWIESTIVLVALLR